VNYRPSDDVQQKLPSPRKLLRKPEDCNNICQKRLEGILLAYLYTIPPHELAHVGIQLCTMSRPAVVSLVSRCVVLNIDRSSCVVLNIRLFNDASISKIICVKTS